MEYSFPQVVKLSDICRVCLMQVDNMKYLLDEDEEVSALITMLESLATLEFQRSDVLPAYICILCQNKLKAAYDFQQLYLKSHETIKTILSNMEEVPDLNEPHKNNHFVQLNSVDINLEDNTKETIPETLEDNNKNSEKEYNPDNSSETAFTTSNQCSGEIYENISVEVIGVTVNTDTKVEECNIFPNNVDSPIITPEEKQVMPPEQFSTVSKTHAEQSRTASRRKSKQTPRLEQFPIEEVNKAIRNVNKKFWENSKCLKCSFVASNARALTLHISHVHKDVRDRWCSQCNLEFDDLAKHWKTHTQEEMTCQFCSKSFQAKGHLVEHLRCHSVCRPFTCEICGKCFISNRHLRVHIKVHNKYRQECKICDKKFKHYIRFKKHLEKYHEVKCSVQTCFFYSSSDASSGLLCPFCSEQNKETGENVSSEMEDKTSEKLDKIIDHLPSRSEQSSELQNYCKLCDKKVRSLSSHKDKFHNNRSDDQSVTEDNNTNLCSICGKVFKSPARLKAHMRIHTGETPYQCSYCDKKVLSRNHLVVHERIHTGEKPYICKYCDKGFAQSTVLATHMRLHTGRPIQCNICEQRFCRKGELQLHMRKHTGEKPYLCTECGKAFIQRSHLMEHIKTHSGERPYKCQYCEKAFRQHSSLKSHESIHLGHKPFKCPECPYACRQSHSLTQHMWVHGGDGPKAKKQHACLLCDKQFSTVSLLRNHSVTMHNLVE